MADTDIVWPVGTTDREPDLSDRPLVFHPKGFLVAILPDADAAERAASALHAAGFAGRKLRIFTSEKILEDYARYTGQPSRTRCAVAASTDDQEAIAVPRCTYGTTGTAGRATPTSGTPPTDPISTTRGTIR